jgi:hypothetical protein
MQSQARKLLLSSYESKIALYFRTMNRRSVIGIPIFSSVLLTSTNLNAQTSEDDDWNDSCRDAGFEEGQNGPFNDATYDHCGDEATGDQAYLDGFIDGCMSVEGNTRDVCESAADV